MNNMNDARSREYTTKDIGEASALITHGCEMTAMRWKDNTAYFTFNREVERVLSLSDKYFGGGLTVEPRIYHDNLRMLKRRVLSNKNLKREFKEHFRR